MWLLLAQAPEVPLVLNWRELMTIGVAIVVIFLSYALKESLSTKAHVHITRQDPGRGQGKEANEPVS